MITKLRITGEIEVITGMHIGDSGNFSAIGAVDSTVIRDKLTHLPIIPGSSLKGKIRYLLASKYNKRIVSNPNKDDEKIASLFGTGNSETGDGKRSRLIFYDLFLWKANELLSGELKQEQLGNIIEIKSENAINRMSTKANPRQIERVIPGMKFQLNLIYTVNRHELKEIIDEEEREVSEEGIKKIMRMDLELLREGFDLLEYDYLGGHGSRGYGMVRFDNLNVEDVLGVTQQEDLNKYSKILKGDDK